jgi:fumarate hydratase class II
MVPAPGIRVQSCGSDQATKHLKRQGLRKSGPCWVASTPGRKRDTHSITILTDGCANFRRFLVDGAKPNLKKINEYVERSLMLVTALSPVIGYDRASKIAHYAMDNDLTLKAAALQLGFVTEAEFDRVVDPRKMVQPYVAASAAESEAAHL